MYKRPRARHTIPCFANPSCKDETFEATAGKGEMLAPSIFCYSHNVFYPIKDKDTYFSYILFIVRKCIPFGPFQNFVVW